MKEAMNPNISQTQERCCHGDLMLLSAEDKVAASV